MEAVESVMTIKVKVVEALWNCDRQLASVKTAPYSELTPQLELVCRGSMHKARRLENTWNIRHIFCPSFNF